MVGSQSSISTDLSQPFWMSTELSHQASPPQLSHLTGSHDLVAKYGGHRNLKIHLLPFHWRGSDVGRANHVILEPCN